MKKKELYICISDVAIWEGPSRNNHLYNAFLTLQKYILLTAGISYSNFPFANQNCILQLDNNPKVMAIDNLGDKTIYDEFDLTVSIAVK